MGYCCRIFTPVQPVYPAAASVRDFLSGALSVPMLLKDMLGDCAGMPTRSKFGPFAFGLAQDSGPENLVRTQRTMFFRFRFLLVFPGNGYPGRAAPLTPAWRFVFSNWHECPRLPIRRKICGVIWRTATRTFSIGI
jgi:hypothetical protein